VIAKMAEMTAHRAIRRRQADAEARYMAMLAPYR